MSEGTTKSGIPGLYYEAAEYAAPGAASMSAAELNEWTKLIEYCNTLAAFLDRLDTVKNAPGKLADTLMKPTRFFYGMAWPDYTSMRMEVGEAIQKIKAQYEQRMSGVSGMGVIGIVTALVIVVIAGGLATCSYFAGDAVKEATKPDEVKLAEAGFSTEQIFDLQAKNLELQKIFKLGNFKVFSKGIDLATIAVVIAGIWIVGRMLK